MYQNISASFAIHRVSIKHCSVCHIPAQSLRFKQTQSLHMYAVITTTEGALEENGGEEGKS